MVKYVYIWCFAIFCQKWQHVLTVTNQLLQRGISDWPFFVRPHWPTKPRKVCKFGSFYVFLVGGLEHFYTFFIFPYIGNNHPNWLIFFGGVGQPPIRFVWYNLRRMTLIWHDMTGIKFGSGFWVCALRLWWTMFWCLIVTQKTQIEIKFSMPANQVWVTFSNLKLPSLRDHVWCVGKHQFHVVSWPWTDHVWDLITLDYPSIENPRGWCILSLVPGCVRAR